MLEIYGDLPNERVTGGIYKEVIIYSSTSRGSFLSNKSHRIWSQFFCYFPSKWKGIQLFPAISLFQAAPWGDLPICSHGRCCRAKTNSSPWIGRRTDAGRPPFFWGHTALNWCVYLYIYIYTCIYGYYIYMLIDLVYFNLRYTHIHREIYIYRANRQMCRPQKQR